LLLSFCETIHRKGGREFFALSARFYTFILAII